MKKLAEKKTNNKGFSLVELIIVIAIMAVLIGVLAPQYLKYVEKSRESADLQAIDTMVSAVEIYSATTAVNGTLSVGSDKKLAVTGNVLDALKDAGLVNTAVTEIVLKSGTYTAEWKITFAADGMKTNNQKIADALSIIKE